MSLADKVRGVAFNPWVLMPQVLLSANTVKPMHGVVPRIILGPEWWEKTRTEAQKRTNWHCIACGIYKKIAHGGPWLEGHEQYKIDYANGRQTYTRTVPLCHYCHSYIHDGRLQELVKKGECTKEKYEEIMSHGNAVLKAAGLVKKPNTGPVAPWGEWRLILFGKSYPPIYRDYEEWYANFHGKGTEE